MDIRELTKAAGIDNWFQYIPEGKTKFILRKVIASQFGALSRPILANKGDTVLHAGCYRIEAVEAWVDAVGPQGRVIIIEADPTSAEILEIEARRRGLENVTILQKAIWDSRGKVRLNVSQDPDQTAVGDIFVDFKGPAGEEMKDSWDRIIKVDADTIDSILDQLGIERIDHIHTSISGADIEAINGAEETLNKPGTRIQLRVMDTEDVALIDKSTEQVLNTKVESALRRKGYLTFSASEIVHGENLH